MSGLGAFIGFFLLVCFVVALVCSAIRERDWRQILSETRHFFLLMVIGILVFSILVYLLEWGFIDGR